MNRALSNIAINIGKAGINDNVIEEIKRQLESQEALRIKFSKGFASEKEELSQEIVSKTRSKLVDLRGNVAVIYKRSSKKIN
ncbi:YhbY family RNA-binding protein [Methanobrevibacter curvatus]|jgi:RNA-binding protein|nr:YhbY family RNA-binding protein [Methanobrevibacter curvatus]